MLDAVQETIFFFHPPSTVASESKHILEWKSVCLETWALIKRVRCRCHFGVVTKTASHSHCVLTRIVLILHDNARQGSLMYFRPRWVVIALQVSRIMTDAVARESGHAEGVSCL